MDLLIIQLLFLIGNIFCMPIAGPQTHVLTDPQGRLTKAFEPLALLMRDPSNEQSVSSLSLDANRDHAQTLEEQNRVLQSGESLSLAITNKLLSPLTAFNNKISSKASLLPSLFSANGAILGSAVATPIQLGTLAANNIAAGVTGTLVSLPIAVGSGLSANLIGFVHSAQEVFLNKNANLQAAIQKYANSLIPPVVANNVTEASKVDLKLIGGLAQQSEFLERLPMISSNLALAEFQHDEDTEAIIPDHDSASAENSVVLESTTLTPRPKLTDESPQVIETVQNVGQETKLDEITRTNTTETTSPFSGLPTNKNSASGQPQRVVVLTPNISVGSF